MVTWLESETTINVAAFSQEQVLGFTEEDTVVLELVTLFLAWCETNHMVQREQEASAEDEDATLSTLGLDLKAVSSFLIGYWYALASHANLGAVLDTLQCHALVDGLLDTLDPAEGKRHEEITHKREYVSNLLSFQILKHYTWDYRLRAIWLRNVACCMTEHGVKQGGLQAKGFCDNDQMQERVVLEVKGETDDGHVTPGHITFKSLTMKESSAAKENFRSGLGLPRSADAASSNSLAGSVAKGIGMIRKAGIQPGEKARWYLSEDQAPVAENHPTKLEGKDLALPLKRILHGLITPPSAADMVRNERTPAASYSGPIRYDVIEATRQLRKELVTALAPGEYEVESFIARRQKGSGWQVHVNNVNIASLHPVSPHAHLVCVPCVVSLQILVKWAGLEIDTVGEGNWLPQSQLKANRAGRQSWTEFVQRYGEDGVVNWDPAKSVYTGGDGAALEGPEHRPIPIEQHENPFHAGCG